MIQLAKKKKVLVTGATRGIGKAIAEAFSMEGADVIKTGTKESREANYLQVDFSNRDSVEGFLDQLPAVDICINNAGINNIKCQKDYSYDELTDLMDINFNSIFKICQKVSDHMIRQEWGRIINIASIWSVKTKINRSLYTASKHAVVGLSKTLSAELGRNNVLVNCVSPGFTLTELTQKSLSEDEMNELKEIIPMKRMALPNEIAKVVLFLCSENNTYLTGQNLVIDGGFTCV